MRVQVIQGQVQSDALYHPGEEFELPQSEAESLLALVPPPIEVVVKGAIASSIEPPADPPISKKR